MTKHASCACVSYDADVCFAKRYEIDVGDVIEAGGPCECACHDQDDYDHEWEYGDDLQD